MSIASPTRAGASVKSSPLCYAIQNGRQETTQTLIEAGADIALKTWGENNAAGEAAEKASHAYYEFTASEEDWLGKKRTKADLARAQKDCEYWMQFVRAAIARGVKVPEYQLWDAINHKHAELALVLISAGVNPNTAPHGTSVLFRSIEYGLDELTLALLKAGAAVKPADSSSPSSSSALLIAARHGCISMVPALLGAGGGYQCQQRCSNR